MAAVNLTDPVTSVRFELGDLPDNEDNQILSDDLIEGVLVAVGNDNTVFAAERCAWHLFTKYSHKADESLGGPDSVRTSTQFQARASKWRGIYEELRSRRASRVAAPVVVGSAADLEATLNDPTLPQPTFIPGQFDNPGAC